MAWAFISFQQLFIQATKWDRWLYEAYIHHLKFWIKVFGWWILTSAGDTHIADLLDTVYNVIDNVIVSHHGYKSVWSPVLEQPLLQTNPQLNPHDESVMVVIKDAQIVSHILLEKFSWVTWYFTQRHYWLSYFWKKGKYLEIPCNYI